MNLIQAQALIRKYLFLSFQEECFPSAQYQTVFGSSGYEFPVDTKMFAADKTQWHQQGIMGINAFIGMKY